jgi:hypothetical protein
MLPTRRERHILFTSTLHQRVRKRKITKIQIFRREGGRYRKSTGSDSQSALFSEMFGSFGAEGISSSVFGIADSGRTPYRQRTNNLPEGSKNQIFIEKENKVKGEPMHSARARLGIIW